MSSEERWWTRAACLGHAPSWDMPLGDTSNRSLTPRDIPRMRERAKTERTPHVEYQVRKCWQCPVRRECLADAARWENIKPRRVYHERIQGIIGGLTPAERVLRYLGDDFTNTPE